ncbi:DUF1579 domain-containing protein [Bythopirellula goksoeyrii]|uniref:DUF1579 domain-containing protein n=1 Tax=Bythopirellula goksoeyrii TaxID=1400387 RepID=A0A5B9Q7L4_9BACT|nr:DUF1579 domain-containing protein [Bythopirellula goksoeyrii]QEG34987.1 hypothetical protein Pr1d_22770 [Bythopirellula goksoeyrii]
MSRFIAACSIVCLALFTSIVAAQTPQFPSPQEEHEWLKQFEGEWATSSKATASPDAPAMDCSGTMKSRQVGGFWVVNEMQGDIGGVDFNAVQTLGYDPAKKKYVGTWVDSMTDHLWQYEGTVDESGKKLSLVAEGPDMMGTGKMAKYRDSYEFKTRNLVVATAEMMDDKGEWVTFMTGEMKRK